MDGDNVSGGRDHGTVSAPPASLGVSSSERTWATFCHLAAFTVLLGIPLGLIAGPLVVWLIKRNDSAFVDGHGKAAVNFQLSMVAYGIGLAIVSRFMLRSLRGVLAEQAWPVSHGLGLRLIGLRAPFGLGLLHVYLPVFAVLVALDVICTIVAAVRANTGRRYRYPFTIRFIP